LRGGFGGGQIFALFPEPEPEPGAIDEFVAVAVAVNDNGSEGAASA
jgi:hypothetical protein